MEFVRQNVGIRDEVKLVSSKALLHLDIVVTEPILACYLVALWKVINSLVLIKALVKITFAGTRCP